MPRAPWPPRRAPCRWPSTRWKALARTCASSPAWPAATPSEPPATGPPARVCENTAMFTGIITGVGRIAAVHDLGSSLQHGKRLDIEAPAGYLDDVGLGDSIALNGASMTVTRLDLPNRNFTIEIS